MSRALELAERGVGWVSPNPMVGAVIVRDGKIIGEGWHARYGEKHAERNALERCSTSPVGATLYVTLEPCCHQGRQPPCTEAILEAGIRRVVIGSGDPNPLVAGRGVEILRRHGVEVTTGVLEPACRALNAIFFHYISTGRPYVVMKYAMTMDGKIATCTGASKWITGEAARQRVQQDRHRYTGIMVGVGTVLADDPLLTCRLQDSRTPVRIVCDSQLRTPMDCRIVQTAREVPTILASCAVDAERIAPYLSAGCQVWMLPERGGHVDLQCLMQRLGEQKIDSVLLEGGGSLNWAALEAGIVQKLQCYIAPKIFGGMEAKSPVSGLGVTLPELAYQLCTPKITQLHGDVLLESEVLPGVHGVD